MISKKLLKQNILEYKQDVIPRERNSNSDRHNGIMAEFIAVRKSAVNINASAAQPNLGGLASLSI